jgi:hypothetical protein
MTAAYLPGLNDTLPNERVEAFGDLVGCLDGLLLGDFCLVTFFSGVPQGLGFGVGVTCLLLGPEDKDPDDNDSLLLGLKASFGTAFLLVSFAAAFFGVTFLGAAFFSAARVDFLFVVGDCFFARADFFTFHPPG